MQNLLTEAEALLDIDHDEDGRPSGIAGVKLDYKILVTEFDDGKAKVKVYKVSGDEVRTKCWIDFTEGGHPLVYDWIPKNEIWIEALPDIEEKFNFTHEVIEYFLMKYGKIEYNDAHTITANLETIIRKWPEKSDLPAHNSSEDDY